jgi:hypothetical protein
LGPGLRRSVIDGERNVQRMVMFLLLVEEDSIVEEGVIVVEPNDLDMIRDGL